MLKSPIIQNAQYSKNNADKKLKMFPKNIKKLKMPENTSKCPNPKGRKCSKIFKNQRYYLNLTKKPKGVRHSLFFVWVSFLIFAKTTS